MATKRFLAKIKTKTPASFMLAGVCKTFNAMPIFAPDTCTLPSARL